VTQSAGWPVSPGIISVCVLFCSMGAAGTRDVHADSDPLTTACPGVAVWKASKPEPQTTSPSPSHVTNPALQASLLSMAKEDQDARKSWAAGPPNPGSGASKSIRRIDAVHLRALRHIVAANGVPTINQVGGDGMSAFWLLVQHADRDLHLQETVLRSLRSANSGVPLDEIALLTDRVRVNDGRAQLYGTQFKQIGDKFVPLRVEDQEHLSARREKMGLMPMQDYECVLRLSYGTAAAATHP